MILFPAIDIKDRKCVRLRQGKFEEMTVYAEDPVEAALRWESLGAEYLHVVDLDGALEESITNSDIIRRIAASVKIPVQTGGGIRSSDKVKELLDANVSRVILGTAAVENMEFLSKLTSACGSAIAVSLDLREGQVMTRGWRLGKEADPLTMCRQLMAAGVRTIVYTDITKDGMMEGPNFAYCKILTEKTSLNIIASGGVSSTEDIAGLRESGLYGAIIGRALYGGRIKLPEALAAAGCGILQSHKEAK